MICGLNQTSKSCNERNCVVYIVQTPPFSKVKPTAEGVRLSISAAVKVIHFAVVAVPLPFLTLIFRLVLIDVSWPAAMSTQAYALDTIDRDLTMHNIY